MRYCAIGLVSVLFALGLFSKSDIAYAHGFGERYDLPVPLIFYLVGAGSVVALSFVATSVIAGQQGLRQRLLLGGWELRGRWSCARLGIWLRRTVRSVSLIVFAIYLYAGLFGTEDPNENIVPTVTWVLFWVGLVYVNALIADVWVFINPWRNIFILAESLYERVKGHRLARDERYPIALGAWPALILFLAFAWVEICYVDSGSPFDIAVLAVAYTVVNVIGMWWFGRETWTSNGDPFSIIFRCLSYLAPIKLRTNVRRDGAGLHSNPSAERYNRDEWLCRPWGAGLVAAPTLGISHSVLVITLLATVSFDGFSETAMWATVLRTPNFDYLGAHAFTMIMTTGLVVTPLLFVATFLVTAWGMGRLGGEPRDPVVLMQSFVYSLIPIAVAYHLAHYFSFLLIQGQRMFALVSDPFGWGWNLFGTTDYGIDVGIIDARLAWFVGVSSVVIGHVVAIYVAHGRALSLFEHKASALRSQYPMLVLMVGYTMSSLWIIAQPVVDL